MYAAYSRPRRPGTAAGWPQRHPGARHRAGLRCTRAWRAAEPRPYLGRGWSSPDVVGRFFARRTRLYVSALPQTIGSLSPRPSSGRTCCPLAAPRPWPPARRTAPDAAAAATRHALAAGRGSAFVVAFVGEGDPSAGSSWARCRSAGLRGCEGGGAEALVQIIGNNVVLQGQRPYGLRFGSEKPLGHLS